MCNDQYDRAEMNQKSEYPNFIGLDREPPKPEDALFHIIPVPCEKTVSYGEGTAKGPKAILEASLQLELFDGISIPADHGVYTHPPVDCGGTIHQILEKISQAVSRVLTLKKLPVLLGGEHSITPGAACELKSRLGEFGVIQFDAHADLRDSYLDDPNSHACAMRRLLDLGIPIFQIGNRSMSIEEYRFREDLQIGHLDAGVIAQNGVPEIILPDSFPDRIFITFDVDAFDPSIIPSTGTPEPGGLTWYDVMKILDRLLPGRKIIGMDMVELAPIPGLHAPDFTIARLLYNFFGMITRNEHYSH
jgi:agmatinase